MAKPNASLWFRYYELDTNTPFFAGRDGIKRYQLTEIEEERRKGYAWAGSWPASVLKVYNAQNLSLKQP